MTSNCVATGHQFFFFFWTREGIDQMLFSVSQFYKTKHASCPGNAHNQNVMRPCVAFFHGKDLFSVSQVYKAKHASWPGNAHNQNVMWPCVAFLHGKEEKGQEKKWRNTFKMRWVKAAAWVEFWLEHHFPLLRCSCIRRTVVRLFVMASKRHFVSVGVLLPLFGLTIVRFEISEFLLFGRVESEFFVFY